MNFQHNIASRSCVAFASLASALVTSAAVYVVGADPRPAVADGRIVTDAYNDATAAFAQNVRHFGYLLGQSAGNPYFTSDPGFNAVTGSGLPTGQQLGFDLVRHVSRWDGVGTVRFLNVPNGESLRYQFGAATATVTGTTDRVAGFPISNIASGGSLHRHLNATLQAGPDDLAAPATGLYFTCMRLRVSGGGIADSDALYIVYNNGLPDADFQRGLAYLANPTPGDANFDARVDFDDLLTLAQNYDANPDMNADASWFEGDFNGDRAVGFDDLLALAQRYGSDGNFNDAGCPSLAGSAGVAPTFINDWARAQRLVPEPVSATYVASLLFRNQRRRR